MNNRVAWFLAAVAVGVAPAHGQVLQSPFDADYGIVDLGAPPGIPANLGGIAFLDGDTLLIGGSANRAAGAIYQIDVVRDPVSQSIIGFAGAASLYATAPNIDGGLAFGPDGVLFYAAYPNNLLGQIKPGSLAPDKLIDLNGLPAPVASSVGTLQFVPAGFPRAGALKVASYNANLWYEVALTPDGLGTFDVGGVGPAAPVAGGPEGIVYIAGSNPGFAADSILLGEWAADQVSVYEIDAQGDPILATRRPFITQLIGAEGAAIDGRTGDFLFSTFQGGNRVLVVTGFAAVIPEPGAAALVLWAGGGWAFVRLRRRVARDRSDSAA